MVAHLVRLRFLILANSLKRSPWQIVAVVFGALYGLGVLALVVVGLFGLSFAPVDLARTVIVFGGAAVILGWIIVPVIASGIDQSVDTARLVTFPIPPDTLLVGLAVSGVLGVPGIVTSIAALATVGTWWQHPIAAVAALICAPIAVLTCVVGSRLFAGLGAGFGAGRRFREAKGMLVFIPLVLLGPIILGLSSIVRGTSDALPGIASSLGWTPLGAIWITPAHVAEGDYASAAATFLIGLATLTVLVALWRSSLARSLESPPHSPPAKAGRRGLGFFGVFPGTPAGAVAARALTYWLRDPRYAQSLVTVPLVPVLLWFYASSSGGPGVLNATGPIVALLLALSIYTDVSYDSTAFALHLQTGVSGAADRLGRVMALAVISVPITVILTLATVWITAGWSALPGLLGICFGVLLTGFALSSVISGRFVFAVPLPGDSPFKARPGGGFSLALSSTVTWGMLAALVLPETVLAIVGFVTGDAIYGWLSLAIGLSLGAVMLVIGVRWGGAILDRRAPEMLAQLQRQR